MKDYGVIIGTEMSSGCEKKFKFILEGRKVAREKNGWMDEKKCREDR